MKQIRLAGAAAGLALLAMIAPAAAEEPEGLLKSILKTAPKAPDAWCQRRALNEATARWRASRGEAPPSADGGDDAPAVACNPVYARKLQDCAAPAGASGDTPAALNARLKACMAELAGADVRPAL